MSDNQNRHDCGVDLEYDAHKMQFQTDHNGEPEVLMGGECPECGTRIISLWSMERMDELRDTYEEYRGAE